MGNAKGKPKPSTKKSGRLLRTLPEPPPEPYYVGYARVSTEDQRLDLQLDALRKAGVKEDNLHIEKISATSKKRPALELAIKDLHEGDTFLVWRLDRLARSMRDLYARLDQIYEAGASFKSITENFDFGTATGKFVLGILGLVAELERQLTIQRTKAGMQAVIERGGKLGAERKMTDAKLARAKAMLLKGKSVKQVAAALKVSKPSIYGHFKIKHRGGKIIVTRRQK